MFGGKPKYVFLFIGDGMGTAQIQSARFYKGTVENNGAVVEGELSFTQFPEVGSVTTYDSTSFCPDSASTATSIATGHKTESGVINMCPWTRDVPYETIAEKLPAQKNYKVGVVSSVNIDHATPAAFYAHQKTRKNYYAIGKELAASGFEYFAGGEFQKVNGDGTGPDNHEIAAQNGYNVVTRQADAATLKAGAGKTLIIAEALADGKAMNYAMDAAAGEWQLTDYVRKGIELLDNKKGFFLMTESGKIDWACHANDAAASIHDVLEMSNAVQAAVDFYNAHPNDTLILVTADHETGGMAIGYKTTNYDTFLTNPPEDVLRQVRLHLCEELHRQQDSLRGRHGRREGKLRPDPAHRPRCCQCRQVAADRLRGGEPAQGLRADAGSRRCLPEGDEPAGL